MHTKRMLILIGLGLVVAIAASALCPVLIG